MADEEFLRESGPVTVDTTSISRFEEAVHWRAGLPESGDTVPLGLLTNLLRRNVDVSSDLRPAPLIPGGSGGVNGGSSITPLMPITAGSRVRSRVTIESRYEKAMKGGPRDFVVVKHALTGDAGELFAEIRQWMIYRKSA